LDMLYATKKSLKNLFYIPKGYIFRNFFLTLL
jgi:hypothetical protein